MANGVFDKVTHDSDSLMIRWVATPLLTLCSAAIDH